MLYNTGMTGGEGDENYRLGAVCYSKKHNKLFTSLQGLLRIWIIED